MLTHSSPDGRPFPPAKRRRGATASTCFALLASCLGTAHEERAPDEQAIIGGAATGEPAGTVTGALFARSASREARFRCSGVLIAPDVVLTAAHCVSRATSETISFTLASELAAHAERESVRARSVRVHPGFQWTASARAPLPDIALVFLAAPIHEAFAGLGCPACELGPGTRVSLVGYGPTDTSEPPPGAARTRNAGTASISVVHSRELRIEGEVQACLGDSGGPAIVVDREDRPRVVGIASRALDPEAPCRGGSIYTRVDAYAAWIEAEISLQGGDHPPT